MHRVRGILISEGDWLEEKIGSGGDFVWNFSSITTEDLGVSRALFLSSACSQSEGHSHYLVGSLVTQNQPKTFLGFCGYLERCQWVHFQRDLGNIQARNPLSFSSVFY